VLRNESVGGAAEGDRRLPDSNAVLKGHELSLTETMSASAESFPLSIVAGGTREKC
jgi:hypothetical protein